MSEQINQVIQRTRRYRYDDGFKELVVGGLMLTVGLLMAIMLAIQEESNLRFYVAGAFILLVAGAGFVAVRVVRTLKERVTFRRSGYVQYREEDRRNPSRWVIVAAAVAFALLTIIGGQIFNNMAVMIGVLTGVVWVVLGAQLRISRFYVTGGIGAVMGIGIGLMNVDDRTGTIAFMLAFGVLMLLTGGLTLRRYLQANPTVTEEE